MGSALEAWVDGKVDQVDGGVDEHEDKGDQAQVRGQDRHIGAGVECPSGEEPHAGDVHPWTSGRLQYASLERLQTEYVDAQGVRYSQESFATRSPEVPEAGGFGNLVSWIRVTVEPGHVSIWLTGARRRS